jgi:hypothetical protein
MLKFDGPGLHEGYGRGIITISYEEFTQNRVYPEQVARGDPIITSTEKRDAIFRDRFGPDHPAVQE